VAGGGRAPPPMPHARFIPNAVRSPLPARVCYVRGRSTMPEAGRLPCAASMSCLASSAIKEQTEALSKPPSEASAAEGARNGAMFEGNEEVRWRSPREQRP